MQILVFIVGIAAFLTLIAYLLAVLFPNPAPEYSISGGPNFASQLPGMIISGISIGFVYAMVALGYTLVYGVLKFINFAHSEIFMFGSVIGFEIMRRLDDAGTLADWNPICCCCWSSLSPRCWAAGCWRWRSSASPIDRCGTRRASCR